MSAALQFVTFFCRSVYAFHKFSKYLPFDVKLKDIRSSRVKFRPSRILAVYEVKFVCFC